MSTGSSTYLGSMFSYGSGSMIGTTVTVTALPSSTKRLTASVAITTFFAGVSGCAGRGSYSRRGLTSQ
jgi:TRAP-type C4-dicarboxylate transport system permease small subunit